MYTRLNGKTKLKYRRFGMKNRTQEKKTHKIADFNAMIALIVCMCAFGVVAPWQFNFHRHKHYRSKQVSKWIVHRVLRNSIMKHEIDCKAKHKKNPQTNWMCFKANERIDDDISQYTWCVYQWLRKERKSFTINDSRHGNGPLQAKASSSGMNDGDECL